jgi:hypothetical protein
VGEEGGHRFGPETLVVEVGMELEADVALGPGDQVHAHLADHGAGLGVLDGVTVPGGHLTLVQGFLAGQVVRQLFGRHRLAGQVFAHPRVGLEGPEVGEVGGCESPDHEAPCVQLSQVGSSSSGPKSKSQTAEPEDADLVASSGPETGG